MTYAVILIPWLWGPPIHLLWCCFFVVLLLVVVVVVVVGSVSLFFSTLFHHHFGYFQCPDFLCFDYHFFMMSLSLFLADPAIS